jgi:hypothetical protein
MSLLIHSIMKKFPVFIEREKRRELLGFLITIKSSENKSHNHCQHSMEISMDHN